MKTGPTCTQRHPTQPGRTPDGSRVSNCVRVHSKPGFESPLVSMLHAAQKGLHISGRSTVHLAIEGWGSPPPSCTPPPIAPTGAEEVRTPSLCLRNLLGRELPCSDIETSVVGAFSEDSAHAH